ncbi:MAG: DMT family transporter [Burkholderiales bacterium]
MSQSASARGFALWGPLLVVLAATGFSFKAIFIKILYAEFPVDPETLLALRMLFALPFFLVMALLSHDSTRELARRDWIMLIAMGFIGYYLSSYLDFIGLQYITAGLERLILFLQPTMVVLLSALFFRTPIRRHHAISLALSYTGIALVFASNLKIAPEPRAILLGGGLVFLSALCYALYMIGSGRVIPRVGAARFTGYASSAACGFAIGQFFLLRGVEALAQPAKVYWLCAAMAAISTVMPIWLMAEGIKRIGANQVAMIAAIGPVLTIFFGWLMLNEAITAVQITGAALVLAGVLLVSVKATAATA